MAKRNSELRHLWDFCCADLLNVDKIQSHSIADKMKFVIHLFDSLVVYVH